MVWLATAPLESGYAYMLSSAMQIVDEYHADLLWPVGEGLQVIASDYSGQHRRATHEVYSFIVMTWDTLQNWLRLSSSNYRA